MADFHYPINISLVRPRLYLGVERYALLGTVVPAGIGVMVAGQGGYYYACFLFALSTALFLAARKMAKIDPYMCAIMLRAMRYKRMYAPRATIHGKNGRFGKLEGMRHHIIAVASGLIVLIVVLTLLGVI